MLVLCGVRRRHKRDCDYAKRRDTESIHAYEPRDPFWHAQSSGSLTLVITL